MQWMADTYLYEGRDFTFQAAGPPQQPGQVTPAAGPHVHRQDDESRSGRIVTP